MRRLFTLAATAVLLAGCRWTADPGDFTTQEKALIEDAMNADGSAFPEGTMRVLTIADRSDSLLLRQTSRDFSAQALLSDEYTSLCSLMVATVTHPSQDGVGIAGPQVGLRRRIVAVQRFDKEGEPFEVYPNIRIAWASDSLAYGPEGCLSVPDMRGEVPRSQEIVIEYADMERLHTEGARGAGRMRGKDADGRDDGGAGRMRGKDADGRDDGGAGRMRGKDADGRDDGRAGRMRGKDADGRDDGGAGRMRGKDADGRDDDGAGRMRGKDRSESEIPMRRDTIKGFTAVIFQHETDHLDGTLYIDRL